MNNLMRTSTVLVNQLDDCKKRKRQAYLKLLGWACLFGVFAIMFCVTFIAYILPGLIGDAPPNVFGVLQHFFAIIGVFVSKHHIKASNSDIDLLESKERQAAITYQNHIKQLETGALSIASFEQQQGELTQSIQTGQLSTKEEI